MGQEETSSGVPDRNLFTHLHPSPTTTTAAAATTTAAAAAAARLSDAQRDELRGGESLHVSVLSMNWLYFTEFPGFLPGFSVCTLVSAVL